jgi:ABC-type uncharacterized transport system permease subunit
MEFAAIFILQVLRIAVPYVLASVGACYAERSGVINIALEGLMLVGAFAATTGEFLTGSAWLGMLCGIAAGVAVAGLHGLITITFKANQIVSGVAINLLMTGITKFVLQLVFGSSANSARINGFSSEGNAAAVLLNPIFILTLLVVGGSQFLFFKTRYGLRLRATGESAETADTLGISVSKMRYSGVLMSGLLASLGGVFLAYEQHSFTDGMSAGRGYISLAAMIIGKWSPVGAMLAAVLFAAAESLQLNLQSDKIPTQLVQSLPYVITLIVLAGFIGKSIPPKDIGRPYEK